MLRKALELALFKVVSDWPRYLAILKLLVVLELMLALVWWASKPR